MAGNRTLIAYFTKSGVTGENAQIIAGVLRDDFDHQVDVVDLKDQRMPDVATYDNVIIGSGIRIGRWYGRAKRQLKDRALAGKRVAIYVSCCAVGNPGGYEEAHAKYLDRVLAKFPHIKPVAAEAFGGRYPKGDVADYRDPEKVRAWTRELGERLKD